MGRKQEYNLQTHGEDLANAVLSGDHQIVQQKLGRIKLLPRFHIKVLEYLVQADVMDDVEQNTLDLQLGKETGKGQNRRCHWSRFRLTPTHLKNASG